MPADALAAEGIARRVRIALEAANLYGRRDG
jgi:hypothetical protein